MSSTKTAPSRAAPTLADPPPPPEASPPRPIGYAWDWTQPAPPEIDVTAAELLARARGPIVLDELAGALEALASQYGALLGRLASPIAAPRTIRDVLGYLADCRSRHATYRRRLALVASVLKQQPPDVTELPAPPDAAAIAATEANPGELARSLAGAAAAAQRELDQVDREIDQAEALGRDEHYRSLNGRRWNQDALAEYVASLARRRAEASARVAALSGDASRVTELVKCGVEAAVKAAGGRARVIECLTAALALAGAQAQPAEASELARVEQDLRRLNDAGVASGPAIDALAARKAELGSAMEASAAANVLRRRSHAEALLSAALSGDEGARGGIESLTRSAPSAFPSGFAAAIESARADRAVFAELARVLG
jgi:hypothetical protein